ncbi:hypothetical protein PYCC9005_005569 [Savitreella phatthalungensis]
MPGKVFTIRHGETEWSRLGKHTGLTDVPLTSAGETRVEKSASCLVGPGRLCDPATIARVIVSPRQRAKRTLELLKLPSSIPVEVSDMISEWDYGVYEGKTSKEIDANLPQQTQAWNVFRDGCPSGDGQESITRRLDELIAYVRALQRENEGLCGNVLIVAHGHILRAFAARWIGDPVTTGAHLLYSAGGFGVLGYEHHSYEEPAIEVWNVTADLWR